MTARTRRTAFAVLLALGVAVIGTAPAGAGPGPGPAAPDVQTQAPTALTTASAVLHGLLNPRTRQTTYWFEVGTTLAYGTTTAVASAGKGDKPVTQHREPRAGRDLPRAPRGLQRPWHHAGR
jgi:hypothetical protein